MKRVSATPGKCLARGLRTVQGRFPGIELGRSKRRRPFAISALSLLALVLALALAGCNGDSSGPGLTPTEAESEEPTATAERAPTPTAEPANTPMPSSETGSKAYIKSVELVEGSSFIAVTIHNSEVENDLYLECTFKDMQRDRSATEKYELVQIDEDSDTKESEPSQIDKNSEQLFEFPPATPFPGEYESTCDLKEKGLLFDATHHEDYQFTIDVKDTHLADPQATLKIKKCGPSAIDRIQMASTELAPKTYTSYAAEFFIWDAESGDQHGHGVDSYRVISSGQTSYNTAGIETLEPGSYVLDCVLFKRLLGFGSPPNYLDDFVAIEWALHAVEFIGVLKGHAGFAFLPWKLIEKLDGQIVQQVYTTTFTVNEDLSISGLEAEESAAAAPAQPATPDPASTGSNPATGLPLLESIEPGTIITIAGGGNGGDGVPAPAAVLNRPKGLAIDAEGNLFISDTGSNRIRRVDGTTGIITTVAGTGRDGYSGDGGLAVEASLSLPYSVAVNSAGDIFFSDYGNQRIRRIDGSTGIITTVSTDVYQPDGVTIGPNGDLFFTEVDEIYRWNPGMENATFFDVNADFYDADSLAVDPNLNVFIANTLDQEVIKWVAAKGTAARVAGSGSWEFSGDGGAATGAGMSVEGIALDADGNLFVADYRNNRVRRVDRTTGLIETVAGNGVAGFDGDFGPAVDAELNHPSRIAFDTDGNLFIADLGNNRVRVVRAATLARSPEPTAASVGADPGDLVWRYDVEQTPSGYSEGWPLLVVGGALYVAGSIDDEAYLYSLDASIGDLLWRSRLNMSRLPPVIHNGLLHGLDGHDMYTLDAATGEMVWEHDIDDYDGMAVADNMVFIPEYSHPTGTGYGYTALDAATGEELWHHGIDSYTAFQPVVANGIVYGGLRGKSIFALDQYSGELLWTYSVDLAGHPHGWKRGIPPALYDKSLYLTGEDPDGWDEHVAALDAFTGEREWRYFTYHDDIFPIVTDGRVFVAEDSGEGYVTLDASTGEVLWRYGVSDSTTFPPVVSNEIVYLGTTEHLYALAVGDGRLLWQYEIDEGAAPVISESVLYTGSEDGYLYALDATSGELLWQYDVGSRIYFSPVVDGTLVYVRSYDGYIYAFSTGEAGATPPPATPEPKIAQDSIRLLSGSVNGHQINVDDPHIAASPGAPIRGSVRIAVHNGHGRNAMFPVGATTSWGRHQDSYWEIDGWSPGMETTEYTVELDLKAPQGVGEYAIIFAAAAETSLAHVMSATHWAAASLRWDDGDDIAGWDTAQLDSAIRDGFVIAPHFGKSPQRFGASAIRISVSPQESGSVGSQSFTSVSSFRWHTCGLREDGSVACWGYNDHGQATPSQGTFTSVNAGFGHTCGVRVDGSVACWGDDQSGQATPPQGRFISLSAGYRHTCGMREDGSVSCWGYDYYGQATPPQGRFISLSAGYEHTCGVRVDGSVSCWGGYDDGEATPPQGRFISVSAGVVYTCGLREDGSVDCWGGDQYGKATPPQGRFTSVSAGDAHTCGVREDGSVACWGNDDDGQATPPRGRFISVSSGQMHTCGVVDDGSVACWGDNDYGQATPLQGRFVSVSVGEDYTCGARESRSLDCWGDNFNGRATPPQGPFTSVSAGHEHACGVMENGSVACWGDDDYGRASPPQGRFTSVDAGWHHTCGMKEDGSVACWGRNDHGQATPPQTRFTSVSGGGWHTCGVRENGSVACWGNNDYGQATPPQGRFTSVSAGRWHNCGVKQDSSTVCWGDDHGGQATPPQGRFTSLSAGFDNTCGVREEGSVACWGNNDDGKATPPQGRFASVSAGYEHTCGVTKWGSVACWGRYARTVNNLGIEDDRQSGVPVLEEPEPTDSALARGTIHYNGRRLADFTDKTPRVWASSWASATYATIDFSYDGLTGQYEMQGFSSGGYDVGVYVDASAPLNGELGYPRDLLVWEGFQFAEGLTVLEIDVDLVQVMHLTSPVDGSNGLAHPEGQMDTYPVGPLLISWGEIEEAVSYTVEIFSLRGEDHRASSTLLFNETVVEPGVEVDLPASASDGWYILQLDAYGQNGHVVGNLFSRHPGGGYRFHYDFRIGEAEVP